MGKIIKRGTTGTVAKYVTRTQAVRRLQLRLAEFRRLCILKGIHPREPKKKFKGQNKTYYHVKDINFLQHEPLLEKFRAISAHQRKVRKAAARKNYDLSKQLARRTPRYTVEHLVRERYPTFIDALRDIDDALCMVHLFATLPGQGKAEVPVKAIMTSRRLALEWQALCCRTSAIRKAFISVKGIYFQADLQGQAITWLVPHSLAQVMPSDVDFRVMLTFLEFYHTLLRFVLFKLYHDVGLKYPPAGQSDIDKAAQELAAIIKELGGAQEAATEQRLQVAKAAALTEKVMQDRLASAPVSLSHPCPSAAAPPPPVSIHMLEGDDEEEDEDEETARLEADKGTAAVGRRGDGSEQDEDEDLDIDSGEEDDEEREGGSAGSGSDMSEPTTASEEVLRMQAERAAEGGGGGAPEVVVTGGTTDAEVCSKLFSGLVVWLGREVPRETLMLVVRSFGGLACWDGPSSPYRECDEAITHAVVDRPRQQHVLLERVYVQPQWVFDSANFRVLVPAVDYAPGSRPPPHLSPFLDYQEEGYVPEYAERLLKLQEAADAARRRATGDALEGGVAAFKVAAEEATAEGLQDDGPGPDPEALFHEELEKELGGSVAARSAGRGKRKAADVEEELADSQKKALMTRKQRKMYEGLRKKEAEKAERVAQLRAKSKAASLQR